MAATLTSLQSHLSDRYRIERELGRGGMGTVFLAEDLKHHRRVAIKVLEPELAVALGRERFLREIEISAGLSHPHVLPVFDSGDADGILYYVMPYVEGESLQARLARENQLPLDDALRIAREVADALAFAHAHGVVHRDIKPGNILLQGGHAVVADFGLARAVASAGVDPAAPTGAGTLTAPGSALGTPAYMSPEQAAGGRDVDGRSDLYSLGCVLYEMLTGQPPFTGATVESLVHQHLSVAPRPVTELRPAVPGWVAVAVQRALAKNPADRFSPVTLFGEALAHGEASGAAAVPPVAPARSARRSLRLVWLGAAVVVVAAGALFVLRPGLRAPAPTSAANTRARSEIAVLPFQNLSADGPNTYFAGGLHDELLTQLSKVAALKVISRTSVMGYAATTKPLKQVAAELGVGSIVEGSVQVVGGRLRVNVQLIDAATDEHLWAERYDRTLDDAFAIQSDIAQQIVAAVGVALSSDERGRLAKEPTANAEAYRLYLQGREYQGRGGYLRRDTESAQQLFERAVQLEPAFALAHAALSEVHGDMLWSRYDTSPTRVAMMRREAETALRIAPGLPQARLAMGYAAYRGDLDYARALDMFLAVSKDLPNDAEVWEAIGSAHRRLGHWNEALAAYEKAVQLDPRAADLFHRLGGTYDLVHRYAEAARDYDTALKLEPDLYSAAIFRAWMFVRWRGNLDSIRVLLARLPRELEIGQEGEGLVWERIALRIYERDPQAVLDELRLPHPEAFSGPLSYTPAALLEAQAHQMRRDRVAARAAFARALGCIDSAVVEFPDDWRVHAARGLALAGLGRSGGARAEADWLERSRVYRKDAFFGMNAAEARAVILAQVGESDNALAEIERLLSKPSWVTVHTLRLDPRWDPIREHPRFKALLVKYANPERSAP